MKIYRDDFDMSLIYNGVNRYWTYNDALCKYNFYKTTKQFKRNNPSEFRKIFKYDALGKRNMPLCYYGKYKVAAPRKFISTLKRLDLLAFRAIEYAWHKKLCTDYYLPIYNLGKHD